MFEVFYLLYFDVAKLILCIDLFGGTAVQKYYKTFLIRH